jgi:hypothetical protein
LFAGAQDVESLRKLAKEKPFKPAGDGKESKAGDAADGKEQAAMDTKPDGKSSPVKPGTSIGVLSIDDLNTCWV